MELSDGTIFGSTTFTVNVLAVQAIEPRRRVLQQQLLRVIALSATAPGFLSGFASRTRQKTRRRGGITTMRRSTRRKIDEVAPPHVPTRRSSDEENDEEEGYDEEAVAEGRLRE